MWRTSLLVVAIALGLYVIVNLLVTTELERVEAEMERLLELARKGGEEAAAEILDVLAEDYDGEVPRRRLENYLKVYVVDRKVEKLSTGSYKTIWKGSDILIPLLAIYATVDGYEARFVLTVTWSERADGWKVTRISRASWGR